MALPRGLKPSVLVRHKALYSGILGRSRFWRVVAVWVFGRRTLKRLFGRTEETLDIGRLGVGRFMSIETMEPLTRRRRRKRVKAGVPVPTRKEVVALATVEAEAAQVARSRSRRAR